MPENLPALAAHITAVAFDWDYTLAYTRVGDNRFSTRLAAMFELAGLPYTQAQIQAALDADAADVRQGILPPMPLHPQTRRQIAGIYARLLKRLGHPDTDWPTMLRLYGTYARLPTYLFDDARAAVEALLAHGYRVGIISNHSTTVRPVIEKLMGDLVDPRHIVISEEEGVHKPARTIFMRTAVRLGAPAQQCAIVGDNLKVDAIGAVHAGGFGQGFWLDRQGANVTCDLPETVDRITSLDALHARLPSTVAR